MLTIEPIEKSILLKEEDVGLIKKVDVLRAIIISKEVGSDLNYLYQVVENMKPIICGKCIQKGKWLDSGSGWKCSNCGFQNEWTIHLKHCPQCCADMRDETNE